MTKIVNSRAISVMGLILGMNFCSYHVHPLDLYAQESGKHAAQERDSQDR